MRLKTTITTLALLFYLSNAFAANQIDIRFFPRAIDAESSAIYVDIEVRTAENYPVVLAGQNYRIYYNSAVLQLDEDRSVSQLPKEKYGSLTLLEKFEHVSADEVGQLEFDDNLGFANFSIELKDDHNGGIGLSNQDGWKTMATLRFKLLEKHADYSVIWGRQSMSDGYATAYVEVAEWIEPLRTRHLEVQDYFDLQINSAIYDGAPPKGAFSIGPNPASNFLQISLEKAMSEAGEVYIKDMSGRTARSINIVAGSQIIRMELTDLIPATYLVELYSSTKGRHFTEQIIITE